MTYSGPSSFSIPSSLTEHPDSLDSASLRLCKLAAVIAVSDEGLIRSELMRALEGVDPIWVEEVILQSSLFAGFPRTLNASREWRRISGREASANNMESHMDAEGFRVRGEATCALVYGKFYSALRRNINALDPALDRWMIIDGYGKILGRPFLDLARRELCIVATCAAAGQDRQLHSHLHGALHSGASPVQVDSALACIADIVSQDSMDRYLALWARVQGKQSVH